MSLIHNEQTKLLATYLNGLAVAMFAVGSLAPSIGMAAGSVIPGLTVGALMGYCLIASLTLHLMGRRVLRRLQP